jgi:hypothetical protein
VDQGHEIGLQHQTKLRTDFIAELVKNAALEKARIEYDHAQSI